MPYSCSNSRLRWPGAFGNTALSPGTRFRLNRRQSSNWTSARQTECPTDMDVVGAALGLQDLRAVISDPQSWQSSRHGTHGLEPSGRCPVCEHRQQVHVRLRLDGPGIGCRWPPIFCLHLLHIPSRSPPMKTRSSAPQFFHVLGADLGRSAVIAHVSGTERGCCLLTSRGCFLARMTCTLCVLPCPRAAHTLTSRPPLTVSCTSSATGSCAICPRSTAPPSRRKPKAALQVLVGLSAVLLEHGGPTTRSHPSPASLPRPAPRWRHEPLAT
jgi:hypothetical protein